MKKAGKMAQKESRKQTILIVEDEPILGKVCARILESNGYLVNLAANGTIAISMVQNTHFDICLSDIRTPEMNGIDFYKYLKEKHPRLAEKTIFMTGDVMSNEIKSFLEGNSIKFILKPFTEAELNSAVSEFIK